MNPSLLGEERPLCPTYPGNNGGVNPTPFLPSQGQFSSCLEFVLENTVLTIDEVIWKMLNPFITRMFLNFLSVFKKLL